MRDFLSNLVTRSLGAAPVVRPRLPSLFETAAPYALAQAATVEENGKRSGARVTEPGATRGRWNEAAKQPQPDAQALEARQPAAQQTAKQLGRHPAKADLGLQRKPASALPATARRSARATARVEEQLEEPPEKSIGHQTEALRAERDAKNQQRSTPPLYVRRFRGATAGVEEKPDSPETQPFESGKIEERAAQVVLPLARRRRRTAERAARPAELESSAPRPQASMMPRGKTAVPQLPMAEFTAANAASLRALHEELDFSVGAVARAAQARRAARTAEVTATTKPPRMHQFEFARHIPPLQQGRASEPSIQVTIGRIEVRAASAQSAPARERTASPVMSLSDYLQRNKRGGQ